MHRVAPDEVGALPRRNGPLIAGSAVQPIPENVCPIEGCQKSAEVGAEQESSTRQFRHDVRRSSAVRLMCNTSKGRGCSTKGHK